LAEIKGGEKERDLGHGRCQIQYVSIDLWDQREAMPNDFISKILTRGTQDLAGDACDAGSSQPVKSLPPELKLVFLLPHTQAITESRLRAP